MGFKLFANSGKIAHGIKNYIADTANDLNNIPKGAGNIVFVIDESKYYTMNSQLDWIEQQNAAGDSNGIIPTGKKIITENGTNIDISEYATADVNVPGIVPSGTKEISITQNSTTTHDVTQYASAEIVTNVNTDPEKGLVFGDYNSIGFPRSARFAGNFTEIPDNYCYNLFHNNGSTRGFGRLVTKLEIPEGVTTIGTYAFYNCYSLKTIHMPTTLHIIKKAALNSTGLTAIYFPSDISFEGEINLRSFNLESVVFGGNVNAIVRMLTDGCNSIELYDFSHCTAIPPLYSVASLGHANGCIIKIPAGLSDTTLGTGYGWESETNWANLTNVVWQPV